jgi:hypothetical protein
MTATSRYQMLESLFDTEVAIRRCYSVCVEQLIAVRSRARVDLAKELESLRRTAMVFDRFSIESLLPRL